MRSFFSSLQMLFCALMSYFGPLLFIPPVTCRPLRDASGALFAWLAWPFLLVFFFKHTDSRPGFQESSLVHSEVHEKVCHEQDAVGSSRMAGSIIERKKKTRHTQEVKTKSSSVYDTFIPCLFSKHFCWQKQKTKTFLLCFQWKVSGRTPKCLTNFPPDLNGFC